MKCLKTYSISKIWILGFFPLIFLFSDLLGQSPKSLNLKKQFDKSPQDEKILSELLKSIRYVDIKSGIKYGTELSENPKYKSNDVFQNIINQELSKCLIAEGNFDKALLAAEKSCEISQKLKNIEAEAMALALKGYIYRRTGKIDLSKSSYEKCLKLSNAIGSRVGKGEAYKGLGDLAEKAGNYPMALENYDLAIKNAREAKDSELQMWVLNATGIIYDYQGNFEKGMDYYLAAIKEGEKIGNLVKVGDIYGNLASINFYLKNDEKAEEYYLKALEIAKTTFNKTGISSACQGIVPVYNRLKKYKEAEKYATLDLNLRKEMNDERGMAYAYKNLGTVNNYLKNYALSEEYYLKGLEYAIKTDQKLKVAVMNLELGRLMNKMGNFVKAEKYLKETVRITKEINVPREQSFAFEDLANTYSNANRMKEAFEAQKQFSILNEKISNNDIKENTARMEAIYETKKKEDQINSLKNDAVLQEKLIEKSNLARNLALLGVALFLLLAGLFFNRSRIKQKNNILLQQKNEEIKNQSEVIQASLEEKETLLREIHHRVKNNLQIISSLLNIQSDNIDDPTLLSNIREGQNRVQAMSLIHQNLYQSDHLSNVDIENYLKELVVYLSEMFEKEDKKIEVEVNANHIEFDIDTAIPLGLIVNELVSNAYKYAFENQETGKIKIDIMALNDIEYELNVNDDGKGLPTDFDPSKSKSLGLKLVKILSKQLRGKFSSSSDKGANFRVLFKDIRAFQLSQK